MRAYIIGKHVPPLSELSMQRRHSLKMTGRSGDIFQQAVLSKSGSLPFAGANCSLAQFVLDLTLQLVVETPRD
jgi:hypothetical protein